MDDIDAPKSRIYSIVRLNDPGGWNLNLTHNPTLSTSMTTVIRHEILHVLGSLGQGDPHELMQEGLMRYYGPLTSASPHNPWRDTDNPGVPVNQYHLFDERGPDRRYECDTQLMLVPQCIGPDATIWDEESGRVIINPDYDRGIGQKAGVVRDILLDQGYALNTYAVQDRSLPRHWYDPSRSGHGVDVRRTRDERGEETHFLHFYTYDQDGQPEWYIASGKLDERMVLEASLDYVTYDAGRSPAAQMDPQRSGTVRLNLDPRVDHPACEGRFTPPPRVLQRLSREQLPLNWMLATLEFDLPDGSGTWCLEPLRFGRERAHPHEGSGSWYAADPEDSGWGLSVMTRMARQHPIIHTVAYYYDANGEPSWAIGTKGADEGRYREYTGSLGQYERYPEQMPESDGIFDFIAPETSVHFRWIGEGEGDRLPYRSIGNGVEIDMLHVHGFCRGCETQDISTTPSGVLNIRINEQSQDANPLNWIERLDLTDQSAVGGHWLREDIGIRLLSSPHPNMADY